MNWYSMIKRFYDGGYWTEDMITNAVEKDKITEAEYKEITGENYATS